VGFFKTGLVIFWARFWAGEREEGSIIDSTRYFRMTELMDHLARVEEVKVA
jgi:hypothetical protein